MEMVAAKVGGLDGFGASAGHGVGLLDAWWTTPSTQPTVPVGDKVQVTPFLTSSQPGQRILGNPSGEDRGRPGPGGRNPTVVRRLGWREDGRRDHRRRLTRPSFRGMRQAASRHQARRLGILRRDAGFTYVDDLPADPKAITVYWRPGCPYCARLRRKLRKLRLVTTEINIWEDREGAATVRRLASGNETVPTVTVGDVGLVNPRASAVVDLARHIAPGAVDPGQR